MSDRSVDPRTAAGDPFHTARVRELRTMEDRYAHELMDDAERQMLRDEIRALRAKLETEGG